MDNKKLQEFIAELQGMLAEDENKAIESSTNEEIQEQNIQEQNIQEQAVAFEPVVDSTIEGKLQETEDANEGMIEMQSIKPLEAAENNNFFKTTLSTGENIAYGASFALSGGKYFDVVVDYVGLVSASGNVPTDITKCELCVWGKSRMYHCEYSIFSLKTKELVGSFSATHNLYYVDLKNLYNKYGDASFRFVANWSGTESVSLDKIELIGKYVKSIDIVHGPNKMVYQVGATFSREGLIVNANYSNGDVVEVTNYNVYPTTLARKDRYVSISYGGFSKKQPIKVDSQKVTVQRTIQQRQRQTSGSSWSEWEFLPVTDADFYVASSAVRETRTVLTIKRSEIELKEKERIGLRLQMYCTKYPKPTEPAKHIKINGMRVKKDPMYNFVNAYIGDLKAEDTEDVQVIIEYDDYPFVFNNRDNKPILFFCDECDPATQVQSERIKVADGSLNLNLCNGETQYEFSDYNAEGSTLGCGISHILSPDSELNFYGRNFSLNICENLISDVINSNKIVKSHLYTDAYGVRHNFKVLFYYVNNGKRVYIPQEEYENISSNLFYQGHPVSVEQITINNQIYIEKPSSAVLNNAYYKSLLSKEANELVLPVRWLKCGHATKGFNAQGNLVLIIDEFNNYIAIDYNADGSINRVSNDSGSYVNFTYDDAGYLASLTNSRNKRVKYSYMAGKLETISYCDLESDKVTENVYKTIKLSYESLKKNFSRYVGVSRIETSDNFITEISYDSSLFSSQINSIHNYSAKAVSDESEVELTELSSLKVEFDYLNCQTILTDDYGDKEIFKYENGKKLINYYSIVNGKVAAAKKIDYLSYSFYTETNAKSSTLNKNSLSGFAFQAGEKIDVELNAFNMPTYTFLSNVNLNSNAYKTVETLYDYDNNMNCIKTEIRERFFDANTKEMTNCNLIITNYIFDESTGKLIKLITHKSHDEDAVKEKANIVEYVYDNQGNRIKEIKYSTNWNQHSTLEDCNCSSTSATDKFYLEDSYDNEHNIISVKDETGLNSVEYEYFYKSKCISNSSEGNRITFFGYDSRDRLSGMSSSVDGENNGQAITYNLGEITELEHSGGSKITVDYDAKRRISCIKIDDSVLGNYSYEDKITVGNDVIDRVTEVNANNTTFKLEVDRAGKFKKEYCNNELQLTKNYNADGRLYKIEDSVSNRNALITYDDYGNIIKFEEGASPDLLTETFEYNGRGLLDRVDFRGIVSRVESYTYSDDSDAALIEISSGNLKIKQVADLNGRLTNNNIFCGLKEISNETITYRKEGNHATFMPLKKSYKNFVKQTLTNTPQNPFITPTVPTNESTIYTYDSFGNIETISQEGVLVAKYHYDKLNRLMREDNYQFDATYCFEYDCNGNITFKRTYKLNSIGQMSGMSIYSYDKDKLISYNSDEFEYDNIGNPTYYRNKFAEWSKGKLLTYFDGNTFEYDGQRRRIKKNNISFYYDSQNRLIKQSDGLEFLYKGYEVVGLKYKNNYYYYRKDMQGNVIAILDSEGKKVVVYCYDAWGAHKLKVLQNSSTEITEVASLNPFTYRSYYYDGETGLYYLNSRYYDPVVGRFLNMDSVAYADAGVLNGLNLYAYCLNNPIMYIDGAGLAPKKIYIRIDDKGKYSEHIHLKVNGKSYSWYRIGHKKRHANKDLGLEDISDTLEDKLKEEGVPDDYFSKSVIIQKQRWQEGFNYSDIPAFREGFSILDLPRFRERIEKPDLPSSNESMDYEDIPHYQEGFNIPDEAIIGGTVTIIAGVVLIGLAFFTGGQSLWGLFLI